MGDDYLPFSFSSEADDASRFRVAETLELGGCEECGLGGGTLAGSLEASPEDSGVAAAALRPELSMDAQEISRELRFQHREGIAAQLFVSLQIMQKGIVIIGFEIQHFLQSIKLYSIAFFDGNGG